jgi:hypothetical protein
VLAHDLVLALDRAELSRTVGITPDPSQSVVLRSEAHRILLNCSREAAEFRIGKESLLLLLPGLLTKAAATPNRTSSG